MHLHSQRFLKSGLFFYVDTKDEIYVDGNEDENQTEEVRDQSEEEMAPIEAEA